MRGSAKMDVKDRFRKLRKGAEPAEKRERVLVVDDLPGVRQELQRLVERYFPNVEVLAAENGMEAIDIIRNKKGDFAYVSLDVIMPGMNGFEVYEIIHRDYPELLAGFCTAFHGQKKTLEDVAKIHGFFGYVVKGPDEDFMADFREIISRALGMKEQLNFDREFKERVRSGRQSLEDLLLVDTLVGERVVARPFDHNNYNVTLVKAFSDTKKTIGAFVDAEDWMVDLAVEEANKAASYWCDETKIIRETHLKLMGRLGDILQKNSVRVGGKVIDLDDIMCHSNLAAYDVITNDRSISGLFASRTADYEEWALRHLLPDQKTVDKVKTVAAFIQSSMYQTGAYGILEALRARKSLIVKLDSDDPYPQYQVCRAFIQAWEELRNEGLIDSSHKAPIQVLAWNTNRHMDRGGKLIRETDATIYMGNPKQAVLVEHRYELGNIKLRTEDQFTELSNLLREKTINSKVLYFTANKGAGFLGGIKSLQSLEEKVDQIVYSVRSHYRSCKRLITLTVDSGWHEEAAAELKDLDFYETAVGLIKKKLGELQIGFTGDREARVVRGSKDYMSKIERYLRKAEEFGSVMRLSRDEHAPAVIELDTEKVVQGYRDTGHYLSSECMFPVLNVVKGGINTAKEVLRKMCTRGDPKNLECSIWTDDKMIYKRFIDRSQTPKYQGSGEDLMVTQTHSYGLYWNEPTTNGLGTLSNGQWKKRGHQLKSIFLSLRTMPR
jgi:CheY-like chemotaxis protein